MTPTPDLKAAALAVTPRPWRAGNKVPNFVYAESGEPICQCDSMDELPRMEECRNAAYIAAANPATILALLERLQVAEDAAKDADRWRAMRECFIGVVYENSAIGIAEFTCHIPQHQYKAMDPNGIADAAIAARRPA